LKIAEPATKVNQATGFGNLADILLADSRRRLPGENIAPRLAIDQRAALRDQLVSGGGDEFLSAEAGLTLISSKPTVTCPFYLRPVQRGAGLNTRPALAPPSLESAASDRSICFTGLRMKR